MVNHNQVSIVKKLLFSGVTRQANLLPAVSTFARKESLLTNAKMNVTRASVICEAASRPHHSQLAAVPLVSRMSRAQSHSFCFLHSVLPREVSSKLKRDFSVFTEDIKINNVQLHSWSLGTSRKKILSIGRSSIACLSSQAHLSCLVLLPGCYLGATSFLLRVQCLQFQSNTLTVPVIAFSVIANSTPRY